MTDLNPFIRLARQLYQAVLSGDEHSASILAADLKAADEAPQSIRPWTDWHKGAAS